MGISEDQSLGLSHAFTYLTHHYFMYNSNQGRKALNNYCA